MDAGPETGRDSDGYDGGSGVDTLSYHQRTTGIFAAAIGSTGGASGENDAIAGFERIDGGAGNDSILGFSSNGGPGNDVLTGSNGGDTIIGGTGADTLRGFGGDDLINANDGIATRGSTAAPAWTPCSSISRTRCPPMPSSAS